MIYLSGHVRPDFGHPEVGVIVTPREGTRPDVALASRTCWAADTGCFSQGERFRIGRYVMWLEEKVAPWRDTCLFVTAPDVLCDHEATWRRSAPVLPLIRALGYKAAFVAQNGIDARRLDEDFWDAFDVLFLGGDTVWKLSQSARALVEEAKRRGRWVHMGRVNSRRRLQRAALWGCDSADGTYLRFGPDANVPKLRRWLDGVNGQRELLGA